MGIRVSPRADSAISRQFQ